VFVLLPLLVGCVGEGFFPPGVFGFGLDRSYIILLRTDWDGTAWILPFVFYITLPYTHVTGSIITIIITIISFTLRDFVLYYSSFLFLIFPYTLPFIPFTRQGGGMDGRGVGNHLLYCCYTYIQYNTLNQISCPIPPLRSDGDNNKTGTDSRTLKKKKRCLSKSLLGYPLFFTFRHISI
jgi:hypothetical protein